MNMPRARTLPRKACAVIFDMDGLIFDTEALYLDAIRAVTEDGGPDTPPSLLLATIGLSLEATRTVYLEHCGQEFDFDAFWLTVSKRFRELAETQLRLKAGVVELLDVLDAARLPRAIATSSRHEDARRHLTAHGLIDRFQTIVASGDYLRGKPSPDPFLKAAERLGVEPGLCLALEDSYNGVRSASSAGMMTIMVPDLLPATDEMKNLCVCVARDLNEVCAMMNS